MMETPHKYVQDAILARHPSTVGVSGALARKIVAGTIDYIVIAKCESVNLFQTRPVSVAFTCSGVLHCNARVPRGTCAKLRSMC